MGINFVQCLQKSEFIKLNIQLSPITLYFFNQAFFFGNPTKSNSSIDKVLYPVIWKIQAKLSEKLIYDESFFTRTNSEKAHLQILYKTKNALEVLLLLCYRGYIHSGKVDKEYSEDSIEFFIFQKNILKN
jgi:hypothetical protein